MEDELYFCQHCDCFVDGRIVYRTSNKTILVVSRDGRAHKVVLGVQYRILTTGERAAQKRKEVEAAVAARDQEFEMQAEARARARIENWKRA